MEEGEGREPSVAYVPWGNDEKEMAAGALALLEGGFDSVKFTSGDDVLIEWQADRDEHGRLIKIKAA